MVGFIVKWPDSEKAGELDSQFEVSDDVHGSNQSFIDRLFEGLTCQQVSQDMESWLY
jgi:hypothetical protein